MARTKKLDLAKTVTTESPIFAGITTTSITGNAATVTTNANLFGVVNSVGNETFFADDPAFTGTVSINSPGYDKTSLNIINNSVENEETPYGIKITSTSNSFAGMQISGSGTSNYGIILSTVGFDSLGMALNTGGSGINISGPGDDAYGLDVNMTGEGSVGGRIIGGDYGVIASGNYAALDADSAIYGILVNGEQIGMAVSGGSGTAISASGDVNITGNLTVAGLGNSNDDTHLEVTGFGNGALIKGKQAAYVIDDDTGSPIEFYHCRFGTLPASRLTIHAFDANIFWENVNGSSRCEIKKPTTIGPGFRALALPNYPGIVNATRIKKTVSELPFVSGEQTYFPIPALSLNLQVDTLSANSLYRIEISFLATHGDRGYEVLLMASQSMGASVGSIGTHASSVGTIVPVNIASATEIKFGLAGVTVAATSAMTYTSFVLKTGPSLTQLSFSFRKVLGGSSNATLKNLYLGATLLHTD